VSASRTLHRVAHIGHRPDGRQTADVSTDERAPRADTAAPVEDPFLWLEEVDSDEALTFTAIITAAIAGTSHGRDALAMIGAVMLIADFVILGALGYYAGEIWGS
jgi:hypothetical protein